MTDASRLLSCLKGLSEAYGLTFVTPQVLEQVSSLLKLRKWNELHDIIGRIAAATPLHLLEIVQDETSSAMADEEVHADGLESMSAERPQLALDVTRGDADYNNCLLLNLSDNESLGSFTEGPTLALPLSPFTPENERPATPLPEPSLQSLGPSRVDQVLFPEQARTRDAEDGIGTARQDRVETAMPLTSGRATTAEPPLLSPPAAPRRSPLAVEHGSSQCAERSHVAYVHGASGNAFLQDAAFASTEVCAAELARPSHPVPPTCSASDIERAIHATQDRANAAEKVRRTTESAYLHELAVAEAAVREAKAAIAAHKARASRPPGSLSPGVLPGFQSVADASQRRDLQVGFFEGTKWAPGWTYFGMRDSKALPGKCPEPNADAVALARTGAISRAELARAATGAKKWTSRELCSLHEQVSNLASSAGFGPPESWDLATWDVLRVQYGWNRSAADLRCRFLNAEAPSVVRAKQNWSAAEDARLRAAMRNADGASDWVEVAAAVGGQRGALACLRRARKLQRDDALRARGTKWTQRENEKVIEAVRVHGSRWRDVALLVGTRDNQSCMHHYRKRLKPGRRVGKWSKEEEKKLREAVAKEGESWVRVAKHVPGRNDVQCREKWKNAMSPTIQMGGFSLGEKALVLVLAHVKNKKWADIARVMTWRTPKQCMRRYKDLRSSAVRGLLTGKRRRDAMTKVQERGWKRIAHNPKG